MRYSVKEIYWTLQGEGANVGRAAVFCRFSGCNLWSGRESDRSSAKCYFCDTDFVGVDGINGGKFASADSLAQVIESAWKAALAEDRIEQQWRTQPFVVFTGGEPLLQLDQELLSELKSRGFETAVETNGTVPAPDGIDWLTVSPKPNAPLVLTQGQELKLVYPHEVAPESVEHLNFRHFYLSPMDIRDEKQNALHLAQAQAYCDSNPKWQLTRQHHKLWGIP